MGPLHRIVIRDKPPVFQPAVVRYRLNRAVLVAAALAVIVQLGALWQVLRGEGTNVGIFDHIAFAVVAVLWVALGVFVFLQRGGRHEGRLFLLSAAAGSCFLAVGTLYRVSLADAVIYTAGLLLFPPVLFAFTRSFVHAPPWKWTELLLYVPALLLVAPASVDLYHKQTTILWKICLLLVTAYLLGAIVDAARRINAARTPEEAAQTRALLFGLSSGTFPGVFAFIAPVVLTGSLGLVTTSWLPVLVLLFLFAMSYSVLLFEFTEADLIVRRGVVYSILTLVIIAAYGILGGLLTVSRASVTNAGGGLSFVIVTVLIGAAFGPVRHAARRLADWLIYGRRVDRWGVLEELTDRLSRVMQPDELGDVLTRELVDALNLRGAFLLRCRPDGSFAVRHRSGGAALPGRDAVPHDLVLSAGEVRDALGDPARSLLIVHVKPLTADARASVPAQYAALDSMRAALTIPLSTRAGVEAVLCLQPKLAHDAFDSDDLELLAPVLRQATAALDNALLFSRLEEKVEELQHAYMRIAREQEAERARLARELHDGTAQELAGLITLATVAERQMNGDGGPARSTLERLREQAETAYQGVRRASHALRPLMLDDFGLVPTLLRHIRQFEEGTGIHVTASLDDVGPLSDDAELALFRVAQECMENVRKHSGASDARVDLHRQNGSVVLSVSDSGQGLTEGEGAPGIGLSGMRERVEAVGGHLSVEGAVDGGLQVVAAVPAGGER